MKPNIPIRSLYYLPVQCRNKHSVEVEHDAEEGVTPNPHRKGQTHHPDDGNVRDAVQKNHQVHEGEILNLRKHDVQLYNHISHIIRVEVR